MTVPLAEVLDDVMSDPDLSNEYAILLACARSRLQKKDIEEIARCCQRSVDWQNVMALSKDHGLFPLFYRGLKAANWIGVPAFVRDELQWKYMANAVREIESAADLISCTNHLEKCGVNVIPFKGIAVAIHAYGDPVLRPSIDMDLLVSARDYDKAIEVLKKRGFEEAIRYSWEVTLVHHALHLSIDLHRTISGPMFPVLIRFPEFYSRLVSLSTTKGEIPALSVEDTVLIASIQIAKDHVSRRSRLKAVCDLAGIVERHPDLNWNALLVRAKNSGCLHVLLVGLAVVQTLLQTELNDAVATRMRQVPNRKLLVADLYNHLFSPEGEVIETLSDVQFSVMVRERWREKAWVRANHTLLKIMPTGLLTWLYRAFLSTKRWVVR